MRATLITTGSVLLTSAVIGNAFLQKKQFYPAVVYINKSNPSMGIIYLQCLVMFLLVGKLWRKIFFGTLRAAELEHLIERAWYAVTELCLAFTVFRDDLNPNVVGIFAVLFYLKCFHWMAEDRVDFMERSPNINILFHARIVSLLTVLATCDVAFIYFAYHSLITKAAGTQLMFGFEYAILLASILNVVMKYILHWIDIASDSPWDEKAVCLLYTELVMSVLRVALYLIFVAAMLKYHNFPLFALRPIYLSLRTLKKAACDVIMSRRAIRNMNTLYPDATHEELANSDNVCIICREEMTGNGTSKKLPCNHIFHVTCLRSWFQRQQTCPTCRMDILRLPSSQGATQAPQGAAVGNLVAGGLNLPVNAANQHQQAPIAQMAPLAQPQLILQDQVAVALIQSFAQIFVQAMLTHLQQQQQLQLQMLQQQQQQLLQQQQQPQPQPQPQPQHQEQPQQQPQQPQVPPQEQQAPQAQHSQQSGQQQQRPEEAAEEQRAEKAGATPAEAAAVGGPEEAPAATSAAAGDGAQSAAGAARAAGPQPPAQE